MEAPKEVLAKEDLQRIWVDILMALLGLIQGLIFNDLANKFSRHMTSPQVLSWVVVAHLGYCLAVLLRVIQTYITAALYYRKQLQMGEILIMTVIGALQHLLAESIRDPSPEAVLVDLPLFHGSVLTICALGSLGYWLTLRGRIRHYFLDPGPDSPREFRKTVVLQLANLAGLAILAILSLAALALPVPYQGWSGVTATVACAVLLANTIYSSRMSFAKGAQSPALTGEVLDLPAVARALIREFGYVFCRFLPGGRDPAQARETQSRILALAMSLFPASQVLGSGRLAGTQSCFALLSRASHGPRDLAQTVLAFAVAIGVYAPWQVIPSLLRAWQSRRVLVPPRGYRSPSGHATILYIVTDPAQRRHGQARRLLSQLESQARAEGAAGLVAMVRTANLSARRLFGTAGFRKLRKYPDVATGAEQLGGLIAYAATWAPAAAVSAVKPAESRPLRRVLVWALCAAMGVVIARSMFVPSRQAPRLPTAPPPASPVPLAAALGEMIRLQTVSAESGPTPESRQALDATRQLLEARFPSAFATARVRRAGDFSLLLHWPGRQAAAPGVMLYAHLDVVPADASGWRYEPFSGEVQGSEVLGRGAIDDKFSVIAILAAVEALLSQGWQPIKPLYVALGHDEELNGEGAQAIAGQLKAARIRLESLLDEGGAVVRDKLPGIRQPVAAVAIAEKGYLDLEICANGTPGHSSSPPPSTAVGRLSRAIARLEAHPPPTRLNPLIRETLTYPAAQMTFPYRFLMMNLWLTGPLVESQLEADPVTRALLGTSQAATLVSGGVKANVLPERACATVNYRLFPGSTAEHVVSRVQHIAGEPGISLRPSAYVPAPSPSSLDSTAGLALSMAIRAAFPDAVVAPVVSPGTTDSRHFAGVADQIYRFSPVRLDSEHLASIHGHNERIPVASLEEAYRFYYTYLSLSAGAKPGGLSATDQQPPSLP